MQVLTNHIQSSSKLTTRATSKEYKKPHRVKLCEGIKSDLTRYHLS